MRLLDSFKEIQQKPATLHFTQIRKKNSGNGFQHGRFSLISRPTLVIMMMDIFCQN